MHESSCFHPGYESVPVITRLPAAITYAVTLNEDSTCDQLWERYEKDLMHCRILGYLFHYFLTRDIKLFVREIVTTNGQPNKLLELGEFYCDFFIRSCTSPVASTRGILNDSVKSNEGQSPETRLEYCQHRPFLTAFYFACISCGFYPCLSPHDCFVYPWLFSSRQHYYLLISNM